MLKVENLHVHYGAIHALKGISIEVPQGKIVTLIGANGAGKSTTLRSLSGLLKPSEGRIILEGKEIQKLAAQEIVSLGMSQVPEGRRVFANMTVRENLDLGAYIRNDKQGIQEDMDKIFLRFPRLKEREKQMAGTLSGGEQQMLAMGRALMSRPRLLLLDEPSMGLAPLIVNQIYNLIGQIRESGITVLLIEQNAKKALSICDYAYVLENGKIKLSGTGEELLASDEVRKAYLGG